MPGDMNHCSSSSNEVKVVTDLISTLLIQGVNAFFPKKQEAKELDETMTLYYRLDVSPTDSRPNKSTTNFVTDPVTNSGIGNRYMSNKDFSGYTKDIISFTGIRTRANGVFDKNMYNETVCITRGLDLIQAVANYEDSGTTSETTVKSQEFAITGATGIFKNFKKLVINYFNDEKPFEGKGKVRTVLFSTH